MKTFELLNNESTSLTNDVWPSCIASFCTELEYLKIHDKNISRDSLEVLSKRCHKLKSLELDELVSSSGLDMLLKVNRNLVSVDLHLKIITDANITFVGDIFEILGQCCPLIQDCQLVNAWLHATDIQIDTFTKGCRNLKSLWVTIYSPTTPVFIYKLLHSLRSQNTALEELALYAWGYNNVNIENIDSLSSEQSASLQSLHSLTLLGFHNLSFSYISHLLNHTTNLQNLNLSQCNLCKDGGVIRKDEGKLKYLERFELFDDSNITDESIINIIKGCHDLEYIDISGSSKLTDICVFSIAENCPNLKTINLDFYNGITLLGLIELLKKCLKLSEINLTEEDLPSFIKDQLKERQNKK